MTAWCPWVLDRPVNDRWFEAYVSQALVSNLKRGDVVIMDNQSSHRRRRLHADRGGRCPAAVPSTLHHPPRHPTHRRCLCCSDPTMTRARRLSPASAVLRKACERTVSGSCSDTGKQVDPAKGMRQLLGFLRR